MAQPDFRVGLLGGAFDPPHAGHVALAGAAVEGLELDALHVVPTGEAWHKVRALTAAHHRLEMAALAFDGIPGVVIDPIETLRPGPSYTIDTLTFLRERYPSAALFLIIGQDQAATFQQWHRWSDIASIATICVAGRAGLTGVSGGFDPQSLGGVDWLPIDMPPHHLSSSEIRRQLGSGADPSGLVFGPVARYIALHHLYRNQAP